MLSPKVCPCNKKKGAYQLTALTMKTRNRNRARRKGTPLIVLSNDWWLNLSWGFRTFAKIYHLYGRNRVRLRHGIDKSRLQLLPTHRKPTKQILQEPGDQEVGITYISKHNTKLTKIVRCWLKRMALKLAKMLGTRPDLKPTKRSGANRNWNRI